MAGQRADQNVNMVCGYRKAAEFVTLAVEVVQRLLDHDPDVGRNKETTAVSSIEQLMGACAEVLPIFFIFGSRQRLPVLAQPSFTLETKAMDLFRRQGVAQSESHEIPHPVLPPMRQVGRGDARLDIGVEKRVGVHAHKVEAASPPLVD